MAANCYSSSDDPSNFDTPTLIHLAIDECIRRLLVRLAVVL